MRSNIEHNNGKESHSQQELDLLAELWRTPSTTQRTLAQHMRISIGLANLLVTSLVRKGSLRVTKSSWRRRLYVLTPKGMIQKLLLTVAFVDRFLNQYDKIKTLLNEELSTANLNAESRVAIYGTGDFRELVYLVLKEHNIEQISAFGPENIVGTQFLGMSVRGLETYESSDFDRIIVAELNGKEAIYSELTSHGIAESQIVTFFESISGEPLSTSQKTQSNNEVDINGS